MNAGMSNFGQQPELAKLLKDFLNRRLAAQQVGSPTWDAEASEVVPHQAAAALAVDPRTALIEGLQAAKLMLDKADAAGFSPNALKTLPDWGMLVRSKENTLGVPFALGNFPQMLQTVQPLLGEGELSDLDAEANRSIPAGGVREWGEKQLAKGNWSAGLFAAAALRLACDFTAAETLLQNARAAAPQGAEEMIVNEEAALAWHQGDHAKAAKLWADHPSAGSIPVQFNRGLAALFAGNRPEAIKCLNQALAGLPADDAWHHLGQLYVLLAEGA
jgi:tetratricopeptide (TPR) repeat protein